MSMPIMSKSRRLFCQATAAYFLGAPTSYGKGPIVFPVEKGEEENTNAENSHIVQNSLDLKWLSREFWDAPRYLWLTNVRGDSVRECYYQDGHVNVPGYIKLCQAMRDLHENKAVQMDLVLLDILKGIQGYYDLKGYVKPIIILSGYRSEKTNNRLVKTENAAKNSQHLMGKAADIRIPGVSVNDLFWFGNYFRAGGVGFYPSSNFIHLDTGNVRFWAEKSTKQKK